MWELVKAGGWLMLPLVLCSIFTVAISLERFIRLKKTTILPQQPKLGTMSLNCHQIGVLLKLFKVTPFFGRSWQ
jgi:hypothetical protein